MSYTKFEFDWFSVLALLIAGGVGLVKAFVNKEKQQKAAQSRPWIEESEKDDSVEEYYTQPEPERDTYTQPEYVFNAVNEGGYSSISADKLEEPVLHMEVIETEDEHIEFDIRQAIIGSEILRKPQY